MENNLQLLVVGVPTFGGNLASPVPAVAEMRGISVEAFVGFSSPSLESFWTPPSFVAPSSSPGSPWSSNSTPGKPKTV